MADPLPTASGTAFASAAPSPGSEASSTAGDRLHALIARRGEPVPPTEAVAWVLGIEACPGEVAGRLVGAIVDGDPRLQWDREGTVAVCVPTAIAIPSVRDATLCVVDLETTGGSPGASGITEIGAVRVHGLQVVGTFDTLVHPGRRIPPHITAITGIDDAMVRAAPSIDDALRQFIEFAGDDVLVAHNAPFDLRFLNYERRRLMGDFFQNPWLDTLVLARRLLGSGVERHDLATLSRWANAVTAPCHRALADAHATAAVLARLIDLMGDGADTRLDHVIAMGQPGGSRMAHKVALAEDLPTVTGVYLMRDGDGRVVRVGSAPNIRRRVRAYFSSTKRQSGRLGRAIETVDRVDHEVTGSEFEADLRAHRLITEMTPACNRPAVGAQSRRYVRLSEGSDGIRVTAVARAPRLGECFGPFGAERSARLASEALQVLLPLATGPGESSTSAGRRALGDDPIAAAEQIALLIERAARAGTLDGGAHAEAIEALVGVVAEMASLARARGTRCVLVEAGVHPDEVVAFVVRDGLVAARVGVHASGEAGAAHRIMAAFGAPVIDRLMPAASLEEINLVRRRVESRVGHPALIFAPTRTGALMDALRRARVAVLAAAV